VEKQKIEMISDICYCIYCTL